MAAGAPNTDKLRDPATGLIKPLKVFLMADGWADDQGESAACAVGMEECGIAPVLPTGDGGYAMHDSCGRWPVNSSTRRRAAVRFVVLRWACQVPRIRACCASNLSACVSARPSDPSHNAPAPW